MERSEQKKIATNDRSKLIGKWKQFRHSLFCSSFRFAKQKKNWRKKMWQFSFGFFFASCFCNEFEPFVMVRGCINGKWFACVFLFVSFPTMFPVLSHAQFVDYLQLLSVGAVVIVVVVIVAVVVAVVGRYYFIVLLHLFSFYISVFLTRSLHFHSRCSWAEKEKNTAGGYNNFSQY